MNRKSITLIGMPGAGKSTIGKILAGMIGFDFVDLDILIKERSGRSHADILEKDGEAELLRLEEKYTLELDFYPQKGGIIFSPGGSIIYSPAAMEKIKNESRIIYLELPIAEVQKRLGAEMDKRGIVGLKEKGIERLFRERVPVYEEAAHYKIEIQNLQPEEAAQKINEILEHE